ncbi:MAG: DUF6580 family putative transport protein, partial [Bacteroidota bacterium]
GYLFRSRWMALGVPLVGMAATDLLFEGTYNYALMAVVWGALMVPALVGPWLRKPLKEGDAPTWKKGLHKALKLFVVAGGSAVFFFLTTNFAVWALDPSYAFTLNGLYICFAVAIPFFKATLAANLMYSFAFFGAFEVVKHVAPGFASRFAPAA